MSDSDKQALIDGSATVQTEIVVHNDNLFDKNNANVLNATINTSNKTITAGSSNRTIYIPCEPNTTYILYKKSSPNNRVIGYSSTLPTNGTVLSYISTISANATTKTITTGNDAQYLVIWVWNSGQDSGTTFDEMLNSIRIEEGTPVSLTETNSVIDWNHEDFRLVKEEGWIGQFVARQVTGNLHNLSDDFSITDKELELKLGVRTNDNTNWYSLGNFLVTKVTDDEVGDKTSFEALDYTKKFNKAFVDRLNYPVTALELAQDVCDQCGVELGSTTFKNSDYVIQGNAFTNNESCRDVMKAIGKLAFSWVRVDWDNKVYIDFDPLPFKNQFDKDNANVINCSMSGSGIANSASARMIYIPIIGGNTYTISKIQSARFRVATTETIPASGVTILNYSSSDSSTSITITANSSANYICAYIYLSTADTLTPQEILDSITIYEQPSQYETFGNNKYYNLKTQKEVFGPVDKVVIGYSAIEGERTYIGEENGTCVLNIFDNPLVFNQEQRAAIIESASDLLGFTYTPLNTLTVGHPWLKGNELVRVTDMEGISHDTFPLDRTIQYFGHIKTLINSTTETKTNDNLSYKPEMVKNYERSEIYNDQINKQIGIIINEQTDTSNRLNETISTLDGTIQRVSNTETSINDITTTTQVSTGKNHLYLEDAVEGDTLSYSVDGLCSQDGTPTPDYPQEVKTIPSIINLLGIKKGQTDTINDVTITITEDGYVKINGTASASINKSYNWAIGNSTYTSTPYNYSFTYVSGTLSNNAYINIRSGATPTDISNQFNPINMNIYSTTTSRTFTPSNSGYITGIQLMASSGVSFNNYICKLQIEEGSVSHEYVPYGYWSKVKVTGKNLIKVDSVYGTVNNVTSVLNNDNSITFTGIPSNTTANISTWKNQSIPIGTYTFSIDHSISTANVRIRLECNDGTYLEPVINKGNTSAQAIATKPIVRWRIWISGLDTTVNLNETLFFQLEQGETATEYESYKENVVLIDMSKENLFDINSTNTTSNCNVSITDNIITITQSGSYPYVEYSTPNLTNGETYTISFDYTKPEDGQISARIYDNTTLTYNVPNFSTPTSGNKFLTFVANENTKVRFYGRVTSGTNTANVTYSNIKIFKGTNPTPYHELCKSEDGTVKDILSIDSNGYCSINKSFGKYIFNGSESWAYQITNGYRTDISNIKQTTSGGENSYVISNYYQTEKQQNLSNVDYGISNRANQSQIIIKNKDCADSTALKTWLSTHLTEVYYVLATPETINLPNTKIPLFEGINHVTFVDDLETDTSITYYRNTPLSGTYATVTQLNEVSTEKTQEIIQVRNEVQTEISSTQASINVINETIENGVSKVNGTGYTFDSEGLKIEKTNQDVKSLLDNDGLAVSYKGTDLLTVRSNGIEAENMTVRKFYVQRPIRMEKTKSISDGSSIGLGFFYVGEE